MCEIIRRQSGVIDDMDNVVHITKETIQYGKSQASYNSDGRLVIRFIQGDSDLLFVLDRSTSDTVINFCRDKLGLAEHAGKIPF